MVGNKTKQTTVSPASFIGSLPPQQRKDSEDLVALMRTITGEPPRMWGSSIVGFGTCHFVYESGREGDICLIASRRANRAWFCMLAKYCRTSH